MTSYKDVEKIAKFKVEHLIKCECGHSMFFQRDSAICSWCGRRVFKDDKAKFKYEMFCKLHLWRNKNWRKDQIERSKYD